MKAFSLTLINLLFIISCGQVTKEVATDQILGEYSGAATFTFKHSLQNVGLEDETIETKGTVSIYKSVSGDSFIRTGDGDLKLAGITLASNGTTFNIPYQNAINEQKDKQIVQGFQTAEMDGAKYDGIYNSDANSLSFGYETMISYDYWGTSAEVGVMCIYEFSKIN
jgi:hypothetical protein